MIYALAVLMVLFVIIVCWTGYNFAKDYSDAQTGNLLKSILNFKTAIDDDGLTIHTKLDDISVWMSRLDATIAGYNQDEDEEDDEEQIDNIIDREDYVVEEFGKTSSYYNGNNSLPYIVVDTNILYDSRFVDLVMEPIFQGRFCVPRFVLEELYTLYQNSDNADSVDRANNALNNFQTIYSRDSNLIHVADIPRNVDMDVDVQLVDYASKTGSVIFSDDGGLMKHAIRRGVRVSSLKDLSESMSEPYGIGEEFKIKIVKKGINKGEGVGFMRDGSRVIVPYVGEQYIDQEVIVKIDQVLKTNNGRMFFAVISNS